VSEPQLPPVPGRPDTEPTHTTVPTAAAGGLLGPYRLLQKVGEGGMGEVWMAEQTSPMRRQVAVKIIKTGMDTARVIARFEAERQALALMDHPAIATVFDGGATAEGRPYFAMEYVKGEPITTYCDRHRLRTLDRLELFVRVCEGVQHAHQKGVVHRDLKPSNVLVTLVDGHPVPKIIDFGVAKATTQHLTERTLFTELGVLVGTPEYMSPEQAELTGLDIDTRTDVYALGVLLYELLTGLLPFDRQMLRQRGLDEIRRVIREVDPPKPSTRVSSPGPDSGEAARNRHTEPRHLASLLRGDLDWITMKALEKDRTRRYDTVIGLANDVRRHLRHEPVVAGPPSTAYRTRKFVQRHRFGVAVAGTLVLLLAGFAVTMADQARRIARERDRANQESARATREADAARQVSNFLVRLFELSDPSEARGNAVTARQILDDGSARIERELARQPEVQSRLMGTMGAAYQSLGLYPASEALLRKGLDLRRNTPGVDPMAVAKSLQDLGYVLVLRGDFAGAEPLLSEALALRERSSEPNDVELSETLGSLGVLAYSRGEYEGAEAFNRRRLDTLRRLPAGREAAISDALNDLYMSIQQARNDYATAKGLAAEALALRRKVYTAPHLALSQGLNNLAMVHYRLEEYDAAEPLFRESLSMNRLLFGDLHPEVVANLSNLGLLARDRGDYREADGLFQQVIAADRKIFGPDHIQVGRALNNWAESVRRSGDPRRAEQLLRESVAIHAKALSPTHWQTATTRSLLARCLIEQGRFPEAERLIEDAYDILAREFGASHTRTTAVAQRAVELYDAWKRPERAAEWRTRLARPPA
jgi:non-specific serine/threonine protein kinase/serine/threonine-protein kinase